MSTEFIAGQIIRAAYPFVRTTYDALPDDGSAPTQEPTWRPGTKAELMPPYGDAQEFADGVGQVIYTVIAVFKPGSYPARVFFIRQWADPDGKTFGKSKLRITTQQAFRTLVKGWRHEYEMSEAA